ncbi:DUF3857 domain-containing transglutaminase family protein [Photobacterium sp. MCCC 1A19761]|uniref:DUF3857 domain-containing transglutaminase family protein n=1 Tax=Photobacterium sp. MCCC 1A19761 TaxID=3115000 RepID=UPI00307E5A45
MKVKLIRTLFILIGISTADVHAENKEDIRWTLTDTNLSQTIDLLSSNQLPTEMTQLLRDTQFHIGPDSVTMRKKIVNYFPRFVDAENYGSQSIYYNPRFQSLRVISAASITREGKIKQIDPSQAQVLDTNEYNTFSSDKEVVLALPGLAEGSFAVLEYEVITQRGLMESDWSEELYTQGNYPIQHYRLDISWDSSQQINWATDSESVHCEQQGSSLTCHGDDLPAYQGDYQAYWRDHIGRVSVGVLDSWKQVIEKASQAMAEANKNTDGLVSLADSLTRGTRSIEENIANILDFVSRDIRYVSMSEHGNAMTPHTIAETIENRFGDCKDKSVLLKALLQESGLSPRLVLVSTQRTADRKFLVPTMNAYNHVIVCFNLEGQEYCVDPTDTQTHWKHTPAWIQGKVILPLESGYIPHPMKTSRYRWRLGTRTDIVFNAQGGQEEIQQRTYSGEYASTFRSNLYKDNESDRQAYLQKQYRNVVSELAEPAFNIDQLDEMAETLSITSKATLPSFLKIEKALNYMENDAWIRDELSDLRLSNERYEEVFPGLSVVSEFNYDTNGLWEFTDLPPSLNFDHPFGSMERTVERVSPTKLTILTRLKIPAQTIQPTDIKRFNELLNTYSEQSLIHFYGTPISTN